MPKAYSYIRFSSSEQAAGDSYRRQMELVRQYASDHGLELDERSFADLGVSSFRGQNKKSGAGLAEFLSLVESGEIESGSVLLVEALDRLSREPVNKAGSLFFQLLQKGIKIVTVSPNGIDEYSGNDPDGLVGLITAFVSMEQAHEESRKKSDRGRAVWRQKQRNASTKAVTSLCPGWLRYDKTKNVFVRIPERVKVVRRIFKLCVDGVGRHQTARMLNEEKIPVFSGRSNGWGESSIAKILSNRSVLGEMQPMQTDEGTRARIPFGGPVEGYYPRIITDDLFAQAQRVIQQRKLKGGRRGKAFSNLFTGIAVCGYCGGSMNYKNRKPTSEREKYLLCRAGSVSRGCSFRKGWPYADFETAFFQHIGEVDLSAVSEPDDRTRKLKELRATLRTIDGRLIEVQKTEQRLVDAITLADTELAALVTRLETTQKEREGLKSARAAAEDEISQLQSSEVVLRRLKHAARNVALRFSELDGDELFTYRASVHQTLQEQISKIEVFLGGLPRWFFHGEETVDPLLRERHFKIVLKNGDRRYVFPTLDRSGTLKALQKVNE